eukprot:gene1465-1702_t
MGSNGASVSPTSSGGSVVAALASSSKIIDAARKGNVDLVHKLLKKNWRKLNKRDERGDTCLHKAALFGHTDCVEVIVKWCINNNLFPTQVNINARNAEGYSPLMCALLNGWNECAKCLLHHGADPNDKLPSNPGIPLSYSMANGTGVYTWRIENFSKIKDRKVYGNTFMVSGCSWKLVAYPKGSKSDDNLSLYVEVADHESLGEGWSHLVSFVFTIANHLDPKKKMTREVHAHRFHRHHTDLGFSQILKKDNLKDKKSGWLLGDVLHVEFSIEVIDSSSTFDASSSIVHNWKLHRVSSLRDRATSMPFTVGDCKWMMAIYPKGKSGGNNLSIYLKVADSSSLPVDWYYLVNFRFSVVNQIDGSKFTRNVEGKKFKANVEDWGFPQFMKLSTLNDPQCGHISAADDSILVELQMEVINDFSKKKHRMTELLATVGLADINCRDHEGFTPFHKAIANGHLAVAKVLVKVNRTKCIESLISWGADLNTVDRFNRTPLHKAICQGDAKLLSLLIKDCDGYSPLHKAIAKGRGYVKMLLEKGADPKVSTNQGRNALHLAVIANELSISEMILDHSPTCCSQADQRGDSPLYKAVRNGNMAMMEMLISRGADVNQANKKNRTPLWKSLKRYDLSCAIYLLEQNALFTSEPGSLMDVISRRSKIIKNKDLVNQVPKCTLSSDLRFLVNNESYKDVTFVVDGNKHVYAWKGILSARSDYFRKMFELPLKESSESHIRMESVDYATLLGVMEYIYTGEIPKGMSLHTTINLFKAANRYMLTRLKLMCELQIVSSLRVHNIHTIFKLADIYDATLLLDECIRYLVYNHNFVAKIKDIYELTSFRRSIIELLKSAHPTTAAAPASAT